MASRKRRESTGSGIAPPGIGGRPIMADEEPAPKRSARPKEPPVLVRVAWEWGDSVSTGSLIECIDQAGALADVRDGKLALTDLRLVPAKQWREWIAAIGRAGNVANDITNNAPRPRLAFQAELFPAGEKVPDAEEGEA